MTVANSVQEMFLLHLRYKEAQHREAGGNRPISLTDPAESWVVYTGNVDVFLVPLDLMGRVRGGRSFLFRTSPGDVLFGARSIETDDGRFGLLAVGTRDASVLQIPTSRLHALSVDDEYAAAVTELVDGWIDQLSEVTVATQPPKETRKLLTGETVALRQRMTAGSRSGIVWIRHIEGHSRFLGEPQLPKLNGQLFWPLSPQTWIESAENSRIETADTPMLFAADNAWPGLKNFHEIILTWFAGQMRLEDERETERLAQSLDNARASVADAFDHLLAPLADEDSAEIDTALDDEAPLFTACRKVCEHDGITLAPLPPEADDDHTDPVLAIARAANVLTRRVRLNRNWWRGDSGALLGYYYGTPVALLPHGTGSYQLYNPVTRTTEKLTADLAEGLDREATVFYRALPHKPLTARDVVRFAIPDVRADLRRLALTGGLLGLLGLIAPAALGLLFDRIIPTGAESLLLQLGTVLLVVTIATALANITQNIAVLRLQDRWGATLQAAVWQRLLMLPVSFFRDYTSGDLGVRVMGINAIQRTLSGTVVSSIVAGIVSLSSFALLFYLESRLALVATALVLVSVVVTIAVGRVQLRYQRDLMEVQGTLAGVVLQAVTGIAKFRMAGAEHRAFAAWARDFGRSRSIHFEARDTANNLMVFNAGYTLLTMAVVFGIVGYSAAASFTTARFLAFNAAFVQLVASLMTLGNAVVRVMSIVPAWERLLPVLETKPEVDEQRTHPGALNGDIELSNIAFRYRPDRPPALRDVSLHARPGEFVAIVGSSGAGKSTLFRLLLGFESAESGELYFDGKAISNLDLRAVRRQIGVVLQGSRVMSGTVLTNIIGSSLLTMEDAWEAAKMAGLETDILNMPMGMHTVVGAGGGSLSGGQRQRLLIARAVASKPRILLFDEATSALDNETQAVVSRSLENLQATRIVIAHRLSTIINADRIYVLDNGTVAEVGTYRELMAQNGIFATLARRQMA